jgi:hypothetical protein
LISPIRISARNCVTQPITGSYLEIWAELNTDIV